MCQDVDPTKPNYVSNIADHPELIDINMISGGGGPGGGNSGDWFHVNGVDYNEELDQIVFSSRFASEVYIIDHSTTTNEAASNNGGNSGMGGNILYRWGNPSNYGISGSQVIPNAVHDSRWIPNDGRPNGGFLQIFNNSGNGNGQSTVDGIETPWDPSTNTYLRNPGQAFEPFSYSTRYQCAYSANGQSASDRMSNGNVFVNASGGQGGAGVMYEVDTFGNIIWGPYNADSQKGFRYECNYPGIIALEPYINTSTTSCFDHTSLNTYVLENILIFPNPTNYQLNILLKNTEHKYLKLEIYNSFGQRIVSKVLENDNHMISNKIDFSKYSKGIYFVNLISNNKLVLSTKVSYVE
jgi:hypothetical protein